MSIPCAGIIVFYSNNDIDQTILVSTKAGYFSFPKGKRHKLETSLQAAWRELEEETGLTSIDVNLINENYLDECSSRKGKVSIRYWVGYLNKTKPEIKFDHDELAHVAWYSIDEALKIEKFKDARKKILNEAYTQYKEFRMCYS